MLEALHSVVCNWCQSVMILHFPSKHRNNGERKALKIKQMTSYLDFLGLRVHLPSLHTALPLFFLQIQRFNCLEWAYWPFGGAGGAALPQEAQELRLLT